MNSIDYLDLLMYNQKKVKDGFKFINLKTHEQITIEDCYDTIKKDLEILEILKNESDNKRIIERNGIASFHLDMILTTDNYGEVKEWLKNAK